MSVFRRPRVAVLSTGNELCEPTARRRGPARCATPTSTSLGAQVEAAGCLATYGRHRARRRGRAARGRGARARRARRRHPLGRLVGRARRTSPPRRCSACRRPACSSTASTSGPGKPTLFARAGARARRGHARLPDLVAHRLRRVHPAHALAPRRRGRPRDLGARAAAPASRRRSRRSSGARTTCACGSSSATASRHLWAEPLAGGSAAISNVVFADGLVRVEAAAVGLAAGDPVDVLLTD